MNCPACGYYNPPAQLTCLHCALVLPVPAGDALCAAHPEVKATGACSRCGTFGCGACLTARGGAWLCASCLSRVSVLPWDERETIGMWRAWWQTSVLMISSPGQALSTAEPDAPLGSSILFALLSSLVGYGPTMLVYSVAIVPVMLLSNPKELGAAIWITPLVSLGMTALTLGFLVVGVLFVAALDHLALMLLGAQPKGFSVTVRASALSMGPSLVGLMPFCSLSVFPLWAIVLRVIATMYLHKTTPGKAVAAVLLPIALLCGGTFCLYASMIGLALKFAR